MSNLLVYFDLREPLYSDVSDFVKYSLDLDKPSGDAVITECLCIINMMLGTCFTSEDLSNWFRNQAPLTDTSVSDLPSRVLKLVTRVKMNTVAMRSYELFETIMRPTVVQEKKMEAARLALHAAYPPGLKSAPPA